MKRAIPLRALAQVIRPRIGADSRGTLYPPRELASVDPTRYAAYVGKYEIRPDFHLRVEQRGTSLMLHMPGQDPLELIPAAETRFFAVALNVEVTFLAIENEVAAMTLRQNGADLQARRVG